MATSQAIIDDVNLRYRNTFSTTQKLVWLNEELQELFDILEIDSPPYAFLTVENEHFYAFPDQFDVTKIRVVTMQIEGSPNYIELPYMRNDDKQIASYGPWWTIVSDAFYLSFQGDVPANCTIYIYCDRSPAMVTADNLGLAPNLPTKYQEILKLGILKRIAGARKDIVMRNNYDMEYQQKIDDILLLKKMKEPEWITPTDVMPKAGGRWRGGTVAITVTQSE